MQFPWRVGGDIMRYYRSVREQDVTELTEACETYRIYQQDGVAEPTNDGNKVYMGKFPRFCNP